MEGSASRPVDVYFSTEKFRTNLSHIAPQIENLFSLFCLNARSLKNKSDNVCLYLESLGHKFHMLAFTETWYSNPSDVVQFDEYQSVFINRTNRKGGGVALYIRHDIPFVFLESFSIVDADYEIIAVDSLDQIVLLIYRPPSGNVNNFILHMENTLQAIQEIYKKILLLQVILI